MNQKKIIEDKSSNRTLQAIRAKLSNKFFEKYELVKHLDETDTLRLNKLIWLIKNEVSTGKIPEYKFKKALTYAEYEQYCLLCNENFEKNIYGEKYPDVLKKYNDLLKIADLTFGKSTKISTSKHNKYINGVRLSTILEYKSQSMYEKANEYLSEILSTQDGDLIRIWLDRSVDFDNHGCEPSNDNIGVARVLGSKSHYAQRQLPLQSSRIKRHDAKITSVYLAIENLIYIAKDLETSQLTSNSEALNNLLNNYLQSDDDLF